MKKQNEFFVYGFLGGFALSIVVFIIIFRIVVQDGIVLNLTRQSLVEQDNRLEIEDGKHVIVITREEQAAPELSIDCDAIRLTNLSGETELEDNLLPPSQEAIIEFIVKNDGGSANNVEVHWSKSLQLPKGLELVRIQDPIPKLKRYNRQSYKMKVIARDMKAQVIVLEFYPVEKASRSLLKHPSG